MMFPGPVHLSLQIRAGHLKYVHLHGRGVVSLSVYFCLATSIPGQRLALGLAADEGAGVRSGACVDNAKSWVVTLFLLLKKP